MKKSQTNKFGQKSMLFTMLACICCALSSYAQDNGNRPGGCESPRPGKPDNTDGNGYASCWENPSEKFGIEVDRHKEIVFIPGLKQEIN